MAATMAATGRASSLLPGLLPSFVRIVTIRGITAGSEQMATPEELWMAWIRAYNERNEGGMRAVMAPDFHYERPGTVVDGAEETIAFFMAECAVFPDGRLDVQKVISSGDHVVTECTYTTTHTVPFSLPDGSTIPPTGRRAVLPCATIARAKDGLLVSNRAYWDNLDMFAQLGWPVPGA